MRPENLSCLLLLAATGGVAAEGREILPESGPPKSERWSVHFQATTVSETHDTFSSPYSGTNSFRSNESFRSTLTATLFLGGRLWKGGEIYFNPEVSGGRGLSQTLGVAGFPNGEATRVGNPEPTPYVARVFLRQRFDFDSESENVEGDANKLAGPRPQSNLTFTIGKLSVGDIFDNNSYSHDPRTQFLNWSLMFNGAWDYPADTRDYTWGGAVEWNRPGWALHYGAFGEPKEANGGKFDYRIFRAFGNVAEFEKGFSIGEHPGKARLLGYLNFARMGNYREALHVRAFDPDITQTRRYTSKFGFGLNAEQEITKDLGLFARAGWND